VYSTLPHFVLGFHGCDKQVCDKILNGKETLHVSSNIHDWLGNGSYFWENDPARALEYAKFIKDNPERCTSKINDPAVIGAVIDLGYCFNLLASKNLKILRQSYQLLCASFEAAKKPMPKNKEIGEEKELLFRPLDCAVIEFTHQINKDLGKDPYDSVRGVFLEGENLYLTAGFKDKNHIQICVRNPNCIKGYFLPRDPIDGHRLP